MTWRAGRFNNSDLGTKVLQKARFQELVEKAGLRDRAEDVVGVQQVAKVLSGPRLLRPLLCWLDFHKFSPLLAN